MVGICSTVHIELVWLWDMVMPVQVVKYTHVSRQMAPTLNSNHWNNAKHSITPLDTIYIPLKYSYKPTLSECHDFCSHMRLLL